MPIKLDNPDLKIARDWDAHIELIKKLNAGIRELTGRDRDPLPKKYSEKGLEHSVFWYSEYLIRKGKEWPPSHRFLELLELCEKFHQGENTSYNPNRQAYEKYAGIFKKLIGKVTKKLTVQQVYTQPFRAQSFGIVTTINVMGRAEDDDLSQTSVISNRSSDIFNHASTSLHNTYPEVTNIHINNNINNRALAFVQSRAVPQEKDKCCVIM